MTRHAKTLLSTTFVLGFAALGLAACDSGGEKAASADPAVVKEAKEVWDTRCTNCHGADGKGNGPGAVALNPKPQSFGDKKWQKMTKDDHIKKVIVEGGAAVGKSEAMAANPDLKDKPEVVAELLKIVRSKG